MTHFQHWFYIYKNKKANILKEVKEERTGNAKNYQLKRMHKTISLKNLQKYKLKSCVTAAKLYGYQKIQNFANIESN